VLCGGGTANQVATADQGRSWLVLLLRSSARDPPDFGLGVRQPENRDTLAAQPAERLVREGHSLSSVNRGKDLLPVLETRSRSRIVGGLRLILGFVFVQPTYAVAVFGYRRSQLVAPAQGYGLRALPCP
jgi:hypothetical protein